jgi:hypothetical protein
MIRRHRGIIQRGDRMNPSSPSMIRSHDPMIRSHDPMIRSYDPMIISYDRMIISYDRMIISYVLGLARSGFDQIRIGLTGSIRRSSEIRVAP